MLAKKKIIIGVIILIFLVTGIIFFYPLSFKKIVINNYDLNVVYIKVDIINGKPQQNSTNYYYKAGSEKTRQIQQILRKFSYHRGIRSWSKNNTLEGNDAGYWIQLYSGESNIICGGTGEIIVNSHVYHIGYWGNKKALALMGEIREVLD